MGDSLDSEIDAIFDSGKSKPFMSADDLEKALSLSEDEITAKFTGQSDLGDPGLDSSRARLALADADTAQEKLNAFRNIYPEGDLQVTPVTGELVFREDKSKPFAKVDAGILEKFEPVNDLIDFLGGDIGAIAGELAFSKGTGSLIGFLTRMFVGGATGEMAQQQVQSARGIQEQSIPEQFEQAGEQGTFSALGGGAGRAVGKTVDVMRGGSSVSLAPGADEAIRAGDRLGIKRNLTVGESTDIPILKKIEGQAGASLPTIQRFVDSRNEELTGIITGITDPRKSKALIRTLATEEAREKGRILGQLGRGSPRTKLTEGGEALTNGITDYSKASQGRVTQAFAHANSIEKPTFNIENLQNELDEVLEGVKFQTAEGGTERAGEGIEGAVDDVINQIKSADPGLPDVVSQRADGSEGVSTAVDQLRAWRSALWDAKTPAKGERAMESHRVAADVYRKINNVLKDPTNTSKEFRNAFKAANEMAFDRFTTLERLLIMRTARDESSDQLARRLATPFNAANLTTLRNTIPARQFSKFQDSFKLNLLEDSSGLTKRLDSFDKETLDMLLSREEQSLYRKVGTQIDRLGDLDIKGITTRQSKVGAAVEELINRNDTASLDLLSDLVKRNGGKNSDLGQQLRAGILQHFSERVLTKERGVTRVAAGEVSKVISDIRKSGLGKFLTTSDMALFANLDKFLPLIKTGADTGTSIQAAEAAAGARGAIANVLTGQSVGGAAFQTILEHLGVGILFTKHAHLLRGLGKTSKKSVKGALGQAGAILTLGANDKQAFNKDDLEKLEIISGTRNSNGN